MAWKNKKITTLTLHSSLGGNCTLTLPNTLKLTGKAKLLTQKDKSLVNFMTEKGGKYVLIGGWFYWQFCRDKGLPCLNKLYFFYSAWMDRLFLKNTPFTFTQLVVKNVNKISSIASMTFIYYLPNLQIDYKLFDISMSNLR